MIHRSDTMIRFCYLSIALLLASTALLAGCENPGGDADNGNNNDGPTGTRVEVLDVEPEPFEDIIEFNGSIEAIDDAFASAQGSGTVVQMADRGQLVSAGQLIAQLDPTDARAAVNQAEAQVETAQSQFDLAQDNFDRQEPLYRDTVISAREFESVRAELNQARANLRQAEAELERAQDQLERTRITAPFNGTIEERMVRQGEQVNAGEQVARIVNISRVLVSAGVPERYADDVSEGTRGNVGLQRDRGFRREARITFVGSTVHPQSRTFPIEVEMSNPEGRLKPEMIARVYLTREEIEDALVVPRPAIMRDEEGTNLYVANRTDDGYVAERRVVTTGAQYGNRTVIESGLEPGDRVIVQGQTNVSPGELLMIEEEHEDTETIDLPDPPDEAEGLDEDELLNGDAQDADPANDLN